MNVLAWVLVAWFVLNAVAGVARVGRRGPEVTPAGAACGLVIYAVLILCVIGAVA